MVEGGLEEVSERVLKLGFEARAYASGDGDVDWHDVIGASGRRASTLECLFAQWPNFLGTTCPTFADSGALCTMV